MLSRELKESNELSGELYDWAKQAVNPTAQTNIAVGIALINNFMALWRLVLLMQPYTQQGLNFSVHI
jgi:hypothetical protein